MNNYSIAVVATMSAGKSTLLNALLGSKILPSKNEACTAKVYSIEDNDNVKSFMARTIKDGKTGNWEKATLELLKEYNESSADRIEICGDIKQIRNMRSGHAVLLYDTPGPNNSRNKNHSEITKEIIQKSSFCSLLCVLNATQLGTDDEFELLTFIKNEIEKKDTISDVLFVLNKVDIFSVSEGDSIRESLEICKKHLRENIGFSKVTLLPISSQLALLSRLLLNSLTQIRPNEVLNNCGTKASNKIRYFKSTLDEEEQFELLYLLKKLHRYKKIYKKSLQFSLPMKRIFKKLNEIQKTNKTEIKKIWLVDRFYSLEEFNEAILLSGVPIIEQYLENKLRTSKK